MATLAKSLVPGKIIASRRPDPKDYRGLRVDYTSVLTQRLHITSISDGVMIREVQSSSPADTARLQADKIILQVNGRPVHSPDDFYREMRNADGPVELTLAGTRGRAERVTLQAN